MGKPCVVVRSDLFVFVFSGVEFTTVFDFNLKKYFLGHAKNTFL